MRVLSLVVAVLILPTVASAQAQKTRRAAAAARKADTVRVVDTLRIADTVRVSDTVRVVDTMRVADTVRLVDTMRVLEPLRIADTVRIVEPTRYTYRDRSQQGRTILTFGLGLTGTTEVLDGISQTTTRTNGQIASFGFTHYMSPDVAFEMAGAVLDAQTSRGANLRTTSAVTSLTFGLSYSPRPLALSNGMRPFVSAAVGPYAHIESQSAAGLGFTKVVSHVGGRFGAGMNMLFARVLAFRLEGVYDVTRPFDSSVGNMRDPSGFGIIAGFGFGWGGR